MTSLFSDPLFGVTTTVAVYALAQALHRRFRWLHPLLCTSVLLIALLEIGKIPYASYKVGGDWISFLLGPATVALAVPFYKHAREIREHLPVLLTAVAMGALVGLVGAALLVRLLHGSPMVLLSMMPKSVTAPISMAIASEIHGEPPLTAVFTVLAGLLGSMVGPAILRVVGIRHDLAIGAAIGTCSHGIGTARLVRESELQGGVSALAMALAGIITSMLAIPVASWLGR
ncbi:MAG: LrgB family protein [Chthoniobacteraceae bacterium]